MIEALVRKHYLCILCSSFFIILVFSGSPNLRGVFYVWSWGLPIYRSFLVVFFIGFFLSILAAKYRVAYIGVALLLVFLGTISLVKLYMFLGSLFSIGSYPEFFLFSCAIVVILFFLWMLIICDFREIKKIIFSNFFSYGVFLSHIYSRFIGLFCKRIDGVQG